MSAATVYEMDEMGAHSDDGTVWLPRSRFTRTEARSHYIAQFANSCLWIEPRVLSRFMRHAPDADVADEFSGEFWVECDRDAPGAFPVWRCEA